MSKGGTKQEETPQQRAMAEFAMNQMRDYERRWLPVQRSLAAQIQQMGGKDSAARRAASGKATTDVGIQFAQARGALEKSLANSGANVNSSRSKLAMTGMAEDEAKSTSLNSMIADQQIDDAYTGGLMALTAIGRGERASVANGLTDRARQSAVQASADAEAAAMKHAGNAQVVGQLAGYGLHSALAGPAVPANPGGTVPGGYIDPQGRQFNNPSAYTPPVGG